MSAIDWLVFRSLLAIWLDKGWGNPDWNVVAKTICCWWTFGFAWWPLNIFLVKSKSPAAYLSWFFQRCCSFLPLIWLVKCFITISLHVDLKLALSRCSWPSPRAFARADYANQDWFPCIAQRAPLLLVLDTGGCYSDVEKAFIVFERCVTLPVGTWSVARKQSFPCVGGHVHNLTTSYFEWKETKSVGNKTAIHRRNCSSVCLLFVKLALLCVFSSFIRPITLLTCSAMHAHFGGLGHRGDGVRDHSS